MELFPNRMLCVSQLNSFISQLNCSQGLSKVSSTHKVVQWDLRLEKNPVEIAKCFGNKRYISIKGARWRMRFYFEGIAGGLLGALSETNCEK